MGVVTWTPELDAKLVELRAAGLTNREIAAEVGRTTEAVRFRFIRYLNGRKDERATPPREAKPKAPANWRPCLRCGDPVRSTGPHHRLCDPCRSGNGLPLTWQAAR